MLKLVLVVGAVTVASLVIVVWWWLVQPLPFAARSTETLATYQPLSSPEKLRGIVEELSKKHIPRDSLHPNSLEQVAAFIQKELEARGLKVTRQFFEAERSEYSNVITRIGPDRDSPLIVVGAHYDAAGPFPGADDNASGVAGLIELASLLSRRKLDTAVELVAYSLEEPPYFATPLMGSAVHVHSLADKKTDIRAMLSLEMIGYFSDEEGSQIYPLDELRTVYPGRGDFIGVVGTPSDSSLVRAVKRSMLEATPLPVQSINAPRFVEGVDFSDHRCYLDLGYPGIMITDTAMFRNPNYHTETDTSEKLDYRRMAMVVDGVARAIEALANGS